MVTTLYQVSGIGPTLNGRNGGGDHYYTDGEIHMAVLVVDGQKTLQAPTELPSPGLVALKDALWEQGASSLKD
jgi:hypothetical protein